MRKLAFVLATWATIALPAAASAAGAGVDVGDGGHRHYEHDRVCIAADLTAITTTATAIS